MPSSVSCSSTQGTSFPLPVGRSNAIPFGAPILLMRHRFILTSLPALFLLFIAFACTSLAEQAINFNRHIRPILSDNCFQCHGPDKNDRESGLRLDIWTDALTNDKIIVKGDPAASGLIQRITAHSVDDRMPPEESGKILSLKEIETLEAWIRQGAEYQGHWAYIPPARPTLPSVKNTEWPRNAIDRFILTRLESEGIAPSSRADKATLARRLALDLTGLPPSQDALDSFLNDNTSEAYNLYLNHLLSLPSHGERMAIQWLDLVRYADTVGYHGDQEMSVWPYRNWVIKAFNSNMPFDQFTREQLAGDLIPNPTRSQLIASGYNRLNMMTAEGGAQDKEYLAKYAADRVRTVSTVWLAGTMGCSECHDHKFDPYTMKDFYSMEAFFADLDEKGFYGRSGSHVRWGPYLQLSTPEDEKKKSDLQTKIKSLKHELANSSTEIKEAQTKWEAELLQLDKSDAIGWKTETPIEFSANNEASLKLLDDNSLEASGASKNADFSLHIESDQKAIHELRLEVIPKGPEEKQKMGMNSGNFILTEFEVFTIDEDNKEKKLKIASATADYSQKSFEIAKTIDSKKDTGWAVDGHKKIERRLAAFSLAEPLTLKGSSTRLKIVLKHESKQKNHIIGRFRIATINQPRATFDDEGIPSKQMAVIRKNSTNRSDKEIKELSAYFRGWTPLLNQTRKDLKGTEAEYKRFNESIPTTLVSKTREKPRTIKILNRGNWLDDSGEVVKAATPAFLPGYQNPDETTLTRLDFANWLTSKDNPLTARVHVNRLWKMLNGTGLSKVLDDLGSQGEWPEHSALLDWLATEFMNSGWDTKHIIRLIAQSSTYQQSSKNRTDLAEKDPFNRLHARQSSYRLDAELIRDNALSVSGLLVKEIGGESVKPYQPKDYYSQLNFPKRTYQSDKGANQYRRGLYTHWQRSFLHPNLKAFDAPSREECTAERPKSNTPLQALALLNDPSYIEAARVFAEHLINKTGSDKDRLQFAWQAALTRPATNEETTILQQLLNEPLSNEEKLVLGVGDTSAPTEAEELVAKWTRVTRAIFNTHEFITRY